MRPRISILLGVACTLVLPRIAAAQPLTVQQRLSRYIDQRFGMFIHYNMNTYHAGWGENRVDPRTFAPPNVDCHTFTDQWAMAAKSAGMKFGILTTKHHDGFALWPSRAVPPSTSPYGSTPYTIAQSAVPAMDVVKCYVESFRAQGLDPNLYFSIWDPNNGVGSQVGHNTNPGPVDWNIVGGYVTTQITELLTNYGQIPMFVFDGYSWLTGHQQVPYEQIRALVHRLQPNAIVLDHNGGVPWEVDTVYFEEPLGVRVPSGNITPGSQGQTIAKNADWFWDSQQASTGYLSATDVANELKTTEPNYTDFILDCPPNLQGLLDPPVVTVLGQVPSVWTPNANRPPLPSQPPRTVTPYAPIGATATSGNAALAIDGYNDWSGGANGTLHGVGGESLWSTTGILPQSITIDLGGSRTHLDILEYLPQRHTGTTAGNITAYKVFVSADGVSFTQVASGTWPASSVLDGLLSPQSVEFTPQNARYIRLEVDGVAGGGTSAVAGEIDVGSTVELPLDGGVGTDGGGGAADSGTDANGSGRSTVDGGSGVDDGGARSEDATRDIGAGGANGGTPAGSTGADVSADAAASGGPIATRGGLPSAAATSKASGCACALGGGAAHRPSSVPWALAAILLLRLRRGLTRGRACPD